MRIILNSPETLSQRMITSASQEALRIASVDTVNLPTWDSHRVLEDFLANRAEEVLRNRRRLHELSFDNLTIHL